MKYLRSILLITALGTSGVAAIAQEEILVPTIITPDHAASEVAYPSSEPRTAFVEAVMTRTTNRFIGTATLRYTRTYNGTTTNWTVRYISTADSMVLISHSDEPLPSVRTQAFVIDRMRNSEVYYSITASDSTVKHWTRTLPISSYGNLFLPDSAQQSGVEVEGHACIKRVHDGSMFHRTVLLDPSIPSLFLDLLSARKAWDGIDHIITAYHLTSAAEGMPMLVELASKHDDGRTTLRVLELVPGTVDPKAFEITKESWER